MMTTLFTPQLSLSFYSVISPTLSYPLYALLVRGNASLSRPRPSHIRVCGLPTRVDREAARSLSSHSLTPTRSSCLLDAELPLWTGGPMMMHPTRYSHYTSVSTSSPSPAHIEEETQEQRTVKPSSKRKGGERPVETAELSHSQRRRVVKENRQGTRSSLALISPPSELVLGCSLLDTLSSRRKCQGKATGKRRCAPDTWRFSESQHQAII